MTAAASAVVYDLDGTLVRLDVDWQAARTDIHAVYDDAGVEFDRGAEAWTLVDVASDHGLEADIEAVLGERERAGARAASRLALADEVAAVDGPVGVCSLNCEDAVRIALERFDLADHVDAVVGRDTVPQQKPHPQPLLTAIERLDTTPDATTFVGDSASDGETADRAGAAFQWVEERLANAD